MCYQCQEIIVMCYFVVFHQVLRELCDALRGLRSEPSVRLVLVTSNGSNWCQGVDLTSFHHSNQETRFNHVHNMTKAIK